MISKAMRQEVYERDNYRCHYCGRQLDPAGDFINRPTIDHKVPVMLGGADSVDNLVTACRSCSSKKSIKLSPRFRPKCKPCLFREIYIRLSYCNHPQAYEYPELKRGYLSAVEYPETKNEHGRPFGLITRLDYAPTWCPIWMKRQREG
jgi:hypothetical protein